jgi:hypothetical protein
MRREEEGWWTVLVLFTLDAGWEVSGYGVYSVAFRGMGHDKPACSRWMFGFFFGCDCVFGYFRSLGLCMFTVR